MSKDTETAVDPVWQRIRQEAALMAESEPMLASFLRSAVLDRRSLEQALCALLAGKLGSVLLPAAQLKGLFSQAFNSGQEIGKALRRDLQAVLQRDPAARTLAQPFLYYKGFHALQAYRVAHWLWSGRREALALFLQNRISEVFAVDIHPAARIGEGILIDHATGVVIGETAVVGDDVSLLHEVTLGGTGKESGDRHPKIGSCVLIGAGAKILGNVKIGEGSKVAAGSVVLHDVPPHATVAGVPARIVGRPADDEPALHMDQQVDGDFVI
jgi:serine O-acetyltransferase